MERNLLQGIISCPLFEGIPKNEVPALFELIKYSVLEKKKGEIIAFAGEKCVNACIILNGMVAGKLYSPSGQCVRVRTHYRGIILAVAFLFAKEKKYPVTLEALSDVRLLCISRNQFKKLIASNQILMTNLIDIISNNVQFYSKRVRLLSFSLKERLSEYLFDLQKTHESDTFTLPLSRQQLAEYLGVQKNSVQRCLVELKKDGVIDFEKKRIRILKNPVTMK